MADNINEKKYLAFIALLSFVGLCYMRSLKACVLSRVSHCEMCCIKCDSTPVSDEFLGEVCVDENQLADIEEIVPEIPEKIEKSENSKKNKKK